MTVRDLKDILEHAQDDCEVILTFMNGPNSSVCEDLIDVYPADKSEFVSEAKSLYFYGDSYRCMYE